LDDAEAALRRLDALSERLAGAGEAEGSPDDEASAKQAGVAVKSAFTEKMNDDLDTPGATAVVFEAIRRANAALDAREHSRGAELAWAALECFAAVGLDAAGASEVPDAVLALGRRRDQARASRDFATADLLRAEIEELGYIVEDTSAGTRIRR
jgi:cysteinyl-tRNA synthetase